MLFKNTKKTKESLEVVAHKKLKRSFLIFKASFLFALLTLSVYGAYSFFTTYKLQSPILLQSPIKKIVNKIISPVASPSAKTTMIRKVYAQEIEKPQEEASSIEIDYSLVANGIFGLESTWGKNDGCRNKGLYNGYGYRQNSFEWVCYETQEEVRGHVISRIKELTKTMDLETAMCYYNTGHKTKGCKYYQNYLSII